MRAGRLMALLLLLQRDGGTTADDLARRLEVSVRTIYRDVSSLQQAGVPLWTESGPGGGVRLLDGWRTTLDGITADEAAALFLPGPPGAAAELGLGSLLATAEVKVMATLPEHARRSAGQVRQRFLLDAPGWFHFDEPVPALPAVADAIWRDRRLDVRYRRAERVVARRLVPLGLVLKAGTWYLVASHRGNVLTYRASRIVTATVRDLPVVRPVGFDLEAWWKDSSRAFDRSLQRARVRLRLSPAARRRLGTVIDPAAAAEAISHATEPDEAGWCEVEAAVESHEVAAGQLVALGGGVEVVEPASLRAAMAEIGTAMAERHRPAGTNWTTGGAAGKARPR